MGKDKAKKINPKKERYAKFHKEKSGTMDVSMPDLDDDRTRQQRDNESKILTYLRTYRRPAIREVSERKAKSKR